MISEKWSVISERQEGQDDLYDNLVGAGQELGGYSPYKRQTRPPFVDWQKPLFQP